MPGVAPTDEQAQQLAARMLGDRLLNKWWIVDLREKRGRGFYYFHPARCRMCKQWMEPLEQLDGRLTLRILPYLIGVIAWLSGKTEGPPKKVPLLVPEHFRVFVADEQRAEQRRRQQALEADEKESFAEHPPP